MASTRKKKGPKCRKFMQEMPCRLNSIQIDEMREDLEQTLLKRADLATKKTAAMKLINDEDKKLEITQEQLLESLRAKSEERLVECEESFIFETNTVLTMRLDTCEQIAERAMTAEEREMVAQGELPISDEMKNGTAEA